MKRFLLVALILLATPSLAQVTQGSASCSPRTDAGSGAVVMLCTDQNGAQFIMQQTGPNGTFVAPPAPSRNLFHYLTQDLFHYLTQAIGGLVLLILLLSFWFSVEQQEVAIIERFGRFVRTAHPGLNFKLPFIEQVAHRVSLRLEQLVVKAETKTKDNVFVTLEVAVQYQVQDGKESDSYYKLQDEQDQIKSYVLDVIRSQVPKMDLDETFVKKEDIGGAVKTELEESMSLYGFVIRGALVTDIDPAAGVKEAMNEIQKQTRLQEAAKAQGEAAKTLTVKRAEAEAEAKKLQGEGIASQRKAIAAGLKEAAEDLAKATGAANASEIMQTLLLTQYFDTIKEIGGAAGTKVIFLPSGPGGMSDIMGQIRTALLSADEAKT